MEELGKFLQLAKEILSRESYVKVINITERDLGCIIDIDLNGAPGEPGDPFSGEVPAKFLRAPDVLHEEKVSSIAIGNPEN